MVLNLDAVEQTRLWLAEGPQAATRVVLGALRAAMLLGERIVLDRNQLYEGVFFIAMTPDRLAWHLGLEPGAPLPISIQLLDGPDDGTHVEPGPWGTALGRRWGAGDDELIARIERSLAAVRRDDGRVSSPLIALTGQYGADSDDTADAGRAGVNAVTIGEAWQTSDEVFVPAEIWRLRDRHVALALRQRGQDAWAAAIRDGRIAVHGGPGPRRPSAAIRIGSTLDELERTGADPSVNRNDIRALRRALVRLSDLRSGATCERHVNGVSSPVIHVGERAVCQRVHPNRRSDVVRWLDGETVAFFDPPTLPAAFRGPDRAIDRAMALRWWNNAYYAGIGDRDGFRLLQLHVPSPAGRPDVIEAELAWGFLPRPVPRVRRWAAMLRRRRIALDQRTLSFSGDIVERLADFAPDQFSRLRRSEVVGSARLLARPTDADFFDLALAVQEASGDRSSRRGRIRSTWRRFAIGASVGGVVAVIESGLLPLTGPGWVAVSLAAGLLLAAPWSDLLAARGLSGGALRTTLRLAPRESAARRR